MIKRNFLVVITLMITSFLFTINLIIPVQGSSFSKSEIEWAGAISGTLYKDDVLKNGNYSIKPVQFPGPVFGVKDINGNWIPESDIEPMALLDIYKDDRLIKEVGVKLSEEPFIDDEYEVKVSATSFPDKKSKEWIYQFYRPWVEISIQLRAKPKFEITISTDKDEYTSFTDQSIAVNVTVTNSGDAFAKNIDLNLDIGDLKLRGGDSSQLHHNFYRVEKGASQGFQVILIVPEILVEEKTYDINASASGYDLKDIKYVAEIETKSVDVMLAPTYFTVNKAIRDNMFLRDIATVRISVANGGIYDISNINISDTLNENFQLVEINGNNSSYKISDETIFWNISTLKPGQDWKTSYIIRPLNVNLEGFIIPSAIAEFTVRNKHYSMSSESVNVVVNGPQIILDKKIDKENAKIGEDIRVTIRVNNIGDIATKVLVKDSLPENVVLISGNMTNSAYVEPNIPQEFSYIIKMNTDAEVKFPSALANYTDMEYMKLIKSTIVSNAPIINAKINATVNISSTISAPVIPQETIPELPKEKNIPNIGMKSLIIILIIVFLYSRRK